MEPRMENFGFNPSVLVDAETWKAIGREFYGDDREKWLFICPERKCKHEQSGHDAYHHCSACGWNAYGLFDSTKLRVEQNGRRIKGFWFASKEANVKLRAADISARRDAALAAFKKKYGARDWKDIKWDDWVPQRVRDQIIEFWGPSMQRSPREWVNDVRDAEPDYGATITEMVTVSSLPNSWFVGGGMPSTGETREVTGRYIHCWNNMGRLITAGGLDFVVSS